MAQVPVETLRRRRGAFKGKITQFLNLLNTEEANINFGRIQSMLTTISKAREGFEQTQIELEEIDPENLDTEVQVQFDADYLDLEGRLLQLLEERKIAPTTESVKSNPKLPDITVPKYDGDVTNWINFRDSFTELVVKRDLSSVAKFRYLETSLQGSSAHNFIKNKSSTEFETAWQSLLDEYDNVSAIKEQHVKTLYDVQLLDDSVKSLQSFLDTVETNLTALRSLDIPVDQWDLLLIHHLSERLSPSLRHEFERCKKPD